MRIVLAFDKFKGTLSAMEACEATARGLSSILTDTECVLCPIADGGEGTVAALSARSPGKMLVALVENALGSQQVAAPFWLDGEVATLEMAAASGLAMIPETQRDPAHSTTYGTGQLMKAALDAGATTIVIGLGGSATNDGGLGMARALGYHFTDTEGKELTEPIELTKLAKITPPSSNDPVPSCLVLVDVTSPLLGPNGATAVFGPQKGIDAQTAPTFEAGLARLADVVKRDLGRDPRDAPGAGAAGGLGFGLLAFCQSELIPGFDYVSARLGLEEAIAEADLVVTGEGRMDLQTLSGKGPHGVAMVAKALGKPVAAIAGTIPDDARAALQVSFPMLSALTDQFSVDEAMTNPSGALESLGRKLAEQFAAHTTTYLDYELSDAPSRIDFESMHALLADTYWCKDIPKARLRRGFDNTSLMVGVYHPQLGQCGMARVVTDFTRFAYIMDVIVAEDHRGLGIGKAMVRYLLDHPKMGDIDTWSLATKDAHGLYEQFDFEREPDPGRWMIRRRQR